VRYLLRPKLVSREGTHGTQRESFDRLLMVSKVEPFKSKIDLGFFFEFFAFFCGDPEKLRYVKTH